MSVKQRSTAPESVMNVCAQFVEELIKQMDWKKKCLC